MSGQEIAQRNPASELADWATSDDRRNELAKIVPEGVSVERFAGLTRTALLKNPELLKADRGSLWLALRAAAAAGLVPDGKKAAIVVYHDRKTDKDVAQFIPMIEGVRDILADYGWMLQTSVVYDADAFGFDEAAQRVTHVPPRLGSDRGQIIGAYAQATHRDGRRMAEVMSLAEIHRVRDTASKAAKFGPWADPMSYPRMIEKTPGHRLAKKLPLDPKDRARLAEIVDADEIEQPASALYGATYDPETGEILQASAPALQPAEEPADSATPSGADGSGGLAALGGEAEAEGGDSPLPEAAPQQPTEADEVAALEASLYLAPGGKYGPEREGGALNLGQIWALGAEGEQYLRLMLAKGRPGDYLSAIMAFCKVQLPDDYAAAAARRAEA